MSTQNLAPPEGGARSDGTTRRNDSANRAYRRAWWSLALYPVTFVPAFVVGEGLHSLLTGDQDDAARWSVILAAVPAILVFAIPGIFAWILGRRAVRLGRSDGKRPAVVGAAIAVGFVVLNLFSGLLQVIFG